MSEDASLQKLHAILSRPEFQADTQRPFWERLVAPLGNVIVSLVVQLYELVQNIVSGRQGWFGAGALTLACIVLVLGALYLIRTIRLSMTHDALLAARSRHARRQRSDELWRTAHELAASGRLDEAARTAYLSALYALDERALLHVETSLTNREHVRKLRAAHPDHGLAFADVVELYDRLRYGRLTVTHESFAQLASLVAAARALESAA